MAINQETTRCSILFFWQLIKGEERRMKHKDSRGVEKEKNQTEERSWVSFFPFHHKRFYRFKHPQHEDRHEELTWSTWFRGWNWSRWGSFCCCLILKTGEKIFECEGWPSWCVDYDYIHGEEIKERKLNQASNQKMTWCLMLMFIHIIIWQQLPYFKSLVRWCLSPFLASLSSLKILFLPSPFLYRFIQRRQYDFLWNQFKS